MRHVGNDIVDLEDPQIATTHLREGFIARVCSESERAILAGSPAPKVLLWSLFAAKEAAFKALCKTGPLVVAPARLVVSADMRSVTYQKQALWLRVELFGPCLHAVAWTDDEMPIFGAAQIAGGAEPGEAARALLVKSLGGGGLTVRRLGDPGSRNGVGPWKLFREGGEVNLDISLSHDGRFVGFAADSSGAEKR